MFAPCPAPFNLAAHVLAAGAATPDKTALQILGTQTALTYAQLTAAVQGTATGLLSHGFAPGDRILLRLGNTADFPIAFLGAITAGLIPIPTSAQLTAPEVASLTTLTGPRATIASPGLPHPGTTPCITTDHLRAFRTLPPAPFQMGDPNRPAYIIFTSGTSGQPRGVVHAHRAIWARRMMFDGWYGLRPTDRMLHAGAFNWTYTLGTGLLDPWTIGATALIPNQDTASTELPHLIAESAATLFAAAPGIYRQILRHTLPQMPTLRHGLSAGEKLPDILRHQWHTQTGTDIHEAFGMSECSTFLSGSPTRPAPPGTMGRPQPGRSTRLIDGQIAIHKDDPGLMLGYLDDPKGTATRYAGDWFLTGDMAEPDGSDLRYLGRSDDMMNSGGFRVSPVEVETVLATHPKVTEAAATQVQASPDTTLIAAFYTGPATPEALRSHCASHLARYKCPHLYIRLDTLPRGPNNKLQRRKLRTKWEAEHGQT